MTPASEQIEACWREAPRREAARELRCAMPSTEEIGFRAPEVPVAIDRRPGAKALTEVFGA